jgi:transglutaminase-like putative cysteine protease
MPVLFIRHRTEYHFRNPVTLCEHRLMSRPRDSHDLRLLETGLTVAPRPAELRWVHDVFGNSIAITSFAEKSRDLLFESTFRAEHFPVTEHAITIEPYAQRLPFSYSSEDSVDLGRTKERQYADPDHRVDDWAREFVAAAAEPRTLDVLVAMTNAIKREFAYVRREEVGVQTPTETLSRRSGSCRDLAVFMMEAARTLGLAARFVSGYLYDEDLVGRTSGFVGGGATHAWLQVYLPGAGWVEFDPTNALVGGRNLIRVAVARSAAQAAPLAGAFIGEPGDLLSMNITVEVSAERAETA